MPEIATSKCRRLAELSSGGFPEEMYGRGEKISHIDASLPKCRLGMLELEHLEL